MHQLGSADVVVGLIAVGLQNPFPVAQELFGALAPAAQLKLKHRFPIRLAVLPQVGLVIFTTLVMHLDGNRGLVSL